MKCSLAGSLSRESCVCLWATDCGYPKAGRLGRLRMKSLPIRGGVQELAQTLRSQNAQTKRRRRVRESEGGREALAHKGNGATRWGKAANKKTAARPATLRNREPSEGEGILHAFAVAVRCCCYCLCFRSLSLSLARLFAHHHHDRRHRRHHYHRRIAVALCNKPETQTRGERKTLFIIINITHHHHRFNTKKPLTQPTRQNHRASRNYQDQNHSKPISERGRQTEGNNETRYRHSLSHCGS